MNGDPPPDEHILTRDYPLVFWAVGTLAIAIGSLVDETIGVRATFVVLGVLAVGFAPVLTVTSDRLRRTLTLRYQSLFRHWMKSYAWDDICGVGVHDDGGEGTYRVELFLQSGERVPLRSWYRAGKWRHQRLARKLESLLGEKSVL
jgi:hypothetical protein